MSTWYQSLLKRNKTIQKVIFMSSKPPGLFILTFSRCLQAGHVIPQGHPHLHLISKLCGLQWYRKWHWCDDVSATPYTVMQWMQGTVLTPQNLELIVCPQSYEWNDSRCHLAQKTEDILWQKEIMSGNSSGLKVGVAAWAASFLKPTEGHL